jgi:hypothetical protein
MLPGGLEAQDKAAVYYVVVAERGHPKQSSCVSSSAATAFGEPRSLTDAPTQDYELGVDHCDHR